MEEERTEQANIRDESRSIAVQSLERYSIDVAERLLRLPPYLFGRINALKYEMRRRGRDVIDLGMGNPTDPPPEIVVRKLCESSANARNHRYSVSVGIYNLRKEVAKWYERNWGVGVDPEDEVVCTIGSKEGFSHLCLALLGLGDTALVPNPHFPVHMYAVMLAGANSIGVPVAPAEELLRSVEYCCKELYPKPKVLIINYPHNPTTECVEVEFFYEVVKLAKRYELLVIHDFAYCETTFDGYHAPSFLQVPGAKDIGVEFTTLSKNYNMAGWRIGFALGNSEMLRALAKIKGYYDYGIFQPVQISAIIALRECNGFPQRQAGVYESRRDVLCRGLRRIGWNVEAPRGTMFVWAPIPEEFASMGSVEFSLLLLENAEVAVAPGAGFGERGEGYIRFALVENEHRLRQAVRQIDRALRKAIKAK